ncbi:putative ras-like gtp-binding protein [Dichotomopilus funicola]|uniref:Ras-like gtp-binding protein n=1 Tax=Dichotomopilus funicola TaxID=1934379 RepID=A0AAN6ZNK4_9PEZI|nr:putative ras-like gtp-binding protein [Dichotomopilus funicola]
MSSSLEAKIVVLGSQGVGKTSLVMRYCKGAFVPSQITSTVGASFLTKRVVDTDTDTLVRLQIWDTGTNRPFPTHSLRLLPTPVVPPQLTKSLTRHQTAGQERFRSISRLYYRGANACILCYSITDAASFAEMGIWLTELRRNLPPDIVLHVVGTKADIVARDPSRREVPFERCIAYVAENLNPGMGSTPPATAGAGFVGMMNFSGSGSGIQTIEPRSPSSKRSSGFWGQEVGWDACHEISAESGEGVEEVFRVVTRKLVEQNRKMQAALLAAATGTTGPSLAGAGVSIPGSEHHVTGYFDGVNPRGGSFRVGRDRRSWLFSPGFSPALGAGGSNVSGAGPGGGDEEEWARNGEGRRRKGCCS